MSASPAIYYGAMLRTDPAKAEGQSHDRVVSMYRDYLARRGCLTADLAAADVAILHYQPHDYAARYRDQPVLARKYVIAYCVWEASDLPDSFRQSIGLVQEVWTCSRYCRETFARHHPNVLTIPHVVARDRTCGEAERLEVRRAIDYQPGCIYFLAVTRLWDKRKNAAGLIRAFCRARRAMPRARLIVKSSPLDAHQQVPAPAVVHLPQQLGERQMNALYELSSAFVSAHHAEGWGLALSDAMLFDKPVIATAYSGNLEFMTPRNSYLVRCREDTIAPEDRYFLYDSRMRWAYPSESHLVETLKQVYDEVASGRPIDVVTRATRDVARFSPEHIGRRIEARLAAIVAASSIGNQRPWLEAKNGPGASRSR